MLECMCRAKSSMAASSGEATQLPTVCRPKPTSFCEANRVWSQCVAANQREPAGHLHKAMRHTEKHRMSMVAAWTKLDIILIHRADRMRCQKPSQRRLF